MYLYLYFLLFIIFLCLVLLFLPFISTPVMQLMTKMSCLEAGYFTTGKIQLSYSIQFIFLLLVFILFDTEILFTFGFLLNLSNILLLNMGLFSFLFITLLLEWKWNKLIWISFLVNELIRVKFRPLM